MSVQDALGDGSSFAAPEPDLTPAELVRRARALRPMLRAQQEAADARGWYLDEVHEALRAGGFYRVVQPRRFGGYEFEPGTLARVVIEIARGHPSSGWCYCLSSSHALTVASHFGAAAQAALFGPDGDFRSPHRSPPAGTLQRVAGGYRVSGAWQYASGAPICTHFMGGAVIPPADGRPPRGVDFIVPRERIEILDDWGGDRSLGMQGSGSHTVRLDDVFVADEFIVNSILLTLPDWRDGTPGTRLHGNPMYLGVPAGIYHATFGAILTGTAHAAIDEFEEIMRRKAVMGNPSLMRTHDPTSQAALGEAMAMTHAAEAITLSVMDEYMDQARRWQATGQSITSEDTFKLWATAQRGCFLACDAVQLLFRAASASSSHKGQRMQRYFRDIQMYLVHPSAQPIVAQFYAQHRLGLGQPLGLSS
ncbi:MAG TPA: hypothetical protein VKS60_23370 [Stellaceae bacterium]|nr:hypothetical protein [Stellaceae bacterium]